MPICHTGNTETRAKAEAEAERKKKKIKKKYIAKGTLVRSAGGRNWIYVVRSSSELDGGADGFRPKLRATCKSRGKR
jgi:hypothetical protein